MRALLTETETAHTYNLALLFVFQRLKIGCFKTAVLKNVCPCYRCSPLFRNVLIVLSWLIVLLLLFPLHASWWRVKIAVIQIMKKYYRKQCILRHHEINDRA